MANEIMLKTGEIDPLLREHWSIILENPYEGVIFVDVNGIIRYASQAFAKYNNGRRRDFLGHHFSEFPIDEHLEHVLQTKSYMMFQHHVINGRNLIASRYPVFRKDNQFAGVTARYFSISSKDLSKKFGDEFIDVINQLQISEIMQELQRSTMELNSYKEYYNEKIQPREGVGSIIGSTELITKLKSSILQISDSPSTVLITGESGTGKELVAKAIHFHSSRATKPFIKVNCAAIPDTLIESELFGYTDGAFTGARKGGKLGKFEMAHKGTIFLDEIGDMPLSMQVKILRVLQEREIEPIGSNHSVPIDVRVVTATNRDLSKMVREGTFREDLYYRINIIGLHCPPLRERKQDIPEISEHIIRYLNTQLGRSVTKIAPETIQVLLHHNWPGNVRELSNILESAMNFCHGSILERVDSSFYFDKMEPALDKDAIEATSMQDKVFSTEKSYLVSALNQFGGSRRKTAAYLEVSKSTLYRMMKKYGLL